MPTFVLKDVFEAYFVYPVLEIANIYSQSLCYYFLVALTIDVYVGYNMMFNKDENVLQNWQKPEGALFQYVYVLLLHVLLL